MTISSTSTKTSYAGDGVTTAFAVPFAFFGADEIEVVERTIATGAEALKTLATDYTVTGGNGSTGTVTAVAAPPASVQWHIRRSTKRTQLVDYTPNDPFPAETHERALDRLTAVAQEQDENASRGLSLAKTSGFAGTLTFPDPGAGKFLRWNAGGTALETTDIAAQGAIALPLTVAQGGTGQTGAAAALAALGGAALSGATFTGAINEAQGADIASAASINLDAATGNLVDITGTTAITAITLSQGRERVVRFTGALTLTHGASLVLPGAANIATASGDFATFRGYTGGVVRCVGYAKANGKTIVPFAASDLPVGTIVDRVYAEYTTHASLTTTIPMDDTIPQKTEGTKILEVTITPKAATNRIRVRFMGFAGAAISENFQAALFIDDVASALCCTSAATQAAVQTPMVLEYEHVAGNTSPRTYKLHVGGNAGAITMNGRPSGRFFGGVARSTLVVEEIVAA